MRGRYVDPKEADDERLWHIGRHNSNPFQHNAGGCRPSRE